jgi:protein tyrosine phosphatase
MLTNLLENKKIKAHCYWPSQVGQTEVFADISVTLDSIEVNENITKRFISVQHQGESEILQLLHIHFTSWPDFGVPQPEDFLKLIEEVEDRSRHFPNSPIVVHCSAGVGRTGTFIAVMAYDELKSNGEVACVQNIVNELRQQRIGMVQTVEQYDFIKQVTQQRS